MNISIKTTIIKQYPFKTVHNNENINILLNTSQIRKKYLEIYPILNVINDQQHLHICAWITAFCFLFFRLRLRLQQQQILVISN